MATKRFAVIGINRFGRAIVNSFVDHGKEVIAIDSDARRLEEIRDIAMHVVRLDSTNEKALREAGAGDVDVAIVAIGSSDIEANILTTRLLKDIGVPYIIARATSRLHEEILLRIGADQVIFLEEEMGKRVAHRAVSPDIRDYFELTAEYNIAEIEIPKRFVGREFARLATETEHIQVQVILTLSKSPNENKEFKRAAILPRKNYILQAGDVLVIMGREADILAFDVYLQKG